MAPSLFAVAVVFSGGAGSVDRRTKGSQPPGRARELSAARIAGRESLKREDHFTAGIDVIPTDYEA